MTGRHVKGRAGRKKAPSGLRKLLDSGKKIMAVWILVNSTVWVYWSYVLATLGRERIAEDLSSNIVTTVIVVFATYAVSSVVEHVSEARHGTILNYMDNAAPERADNTTTDQEDTSI